MKEQEGKLQAALIEQSNKTVDAIVAAVREEDAKLAAQLDAVKADVASGLENVQSGQLRTEQVAECVQAAVDAVIELGKRSSEELTEKTDELASLFQQSLVDRLQAQTADVLSRLDVLNSAQQQASKAVASQLEQLKETTDGFAGQLAQLRDASASATALQDFHHQFNERSSALTAGQNELKATAQALSADVSDVSKTLQRLPDAVHVALSHDFAALERKNDALKLEPTPPGEPTFTAEKLRQVLEDVISTQLLDRLDAKLASQQARYLESLEKAVADAKEEVKNSIQEVRVGVDTSCALVRDDIQTATSTVVGKAAMLIRRNQDALTGVIANSTERTIAAIAAHSDETTGELKEQAVELAKKTREELRRDGAKTRAKIAVVNAAVQEVAATTSKTLKLLLHGTVYFPHDDDTRVMEWAGKPAPLTPLLHLPSSDANKCAALQAVLRHHFRHPNTRWHHSLAPDASGAADSVPVMTRDKRLVPFRLKHKNNTLPFLATDVFHQCGSAKLIAVLGDAGAGKTLLLQLLCQRQDFVGGFVIPVQLSRLADVFRRIDQHYAGPDAEGECVGRIELLARALTEYVAPTRCHSYARAKPEQVQKASMKAVAEGIWRSGLPIM